MSTPNTRRGQIVLTVAHVIGMIDMVALPLWVGALMQCDNFPPARAGITVTLFLLGALIASLVCAPMFNRLPRRLVATSGFGLAAVSFALASRWPMLPSSFPAVALYHASAGVGVGMSLSFTHGCIGRSANPHRLFGLVNVALGLFALLFLGIMPGLIEEHGLAVLFQTFSVLMALAALAVLVAFPQVSVETPVQDTASPPVSTAARLLIAVIICLTLTQSMVFSFMERVGIVRGFGTGHVHGVLIALGFINLLPGLLAAALQRRFSPILVGLFGPLVQAGLALTLSNSATFLAYAVASAMFVSVLIFTHTFLFGLINRLDRTGRTAAATPAMTMAGACIGPALGGAVIQGMGYRGLGAVACAIAFVAVSLMSLVRIRVRGSGVSIRAKA